MKIKIPYKSVVVSSVFLGVLISLQFKNINLENEGMTTSKKGEQLLIELKSLKKESNSLKEQINTIKREIFVVVNFRVNHTPLVLTGGNSERCRRMARLPGDFLVDLKRSRC